MNKKFEYVDDNPGAYFGMLVESLNESDDYESEVKDYNIYAIKKDGSSTLVKTIHGTIRDVEDEINSKFSYLPKLSFIKRIEVRDNNTGEKVYDESLKESVSKSDLYSALEYMYGFNKKEANDWIKKASDKMKQSVVDGWKGNAKKSALTDSLKEDKFIPQDKMSKKAQKELNDKKRRTWGSTNPVTRVQPNKKAYDRKRDSKVVDERLDSQSDFELTYVLDELEELSNYYKSRQDDWSKRDSEEFLEDINSLLHRTQHLFRKAKVLGESKKLNESSDGWDESKLYDLSEILDEIYNLQYEVQNTVRGAYTNARTYEELGYYVHNLGSNLMDIGDEIMEMEEEDEEDED